MSVKNVLIMKLCLSLLFLVKVSIAQPNNDSNIKKPNQCTQGATQQEIDMARQSILDNVTKTIHQYGAKNGFYNDPRTRLPLPKEFKKVEKVLRKVGGKKYLDAAVVKLNEAASDTLTQAKPAILKYLDTLPIDCNMNAITAPKTGDVIAANNKEHLATDIHNILQKVYETNQTMKTVEKMLEKARLLKLYVKLKRAADKLIAESILLLIEISIQGTKKP